MWKRFKKIKENLVFYLCLFLLFIYVVFLRVPNYNDIRLINAKQNFEKLIINYLITNDFVEIEKIIEKIRNDKYFQKINLTCIILTLAESYHCRKLLPLFIEILKNTKNKSTRIAAIQALIKIDEPQLASLEEFFHNLYNNTDNKERLYIVEFLKKYGTEKSVVLLGEILLNENNSPFIRISAIMGLKRIKSPLAINYLKKALMTTQNKFVKEELEYFFNKKNNF